MAIISTTSKSTEEIFAKKCKIINLKYEYPGYIGEAKYGIVTALSDEELKQRYADELTDYSPYIVLSPAFGEIRAEFIRNDEKFKKRDTLYHSQFAYDEETELHHTELAQQDFSEAVVTHEELLSAFKSLTDIQREVILDKYFRGMTGRAIAEKRGISEPAVSKNLKLAMNNLKKILADG